ncbi:MAG: molybdopterin converting factor subunit 1 [Planctomycetota bacterium]
MITIEVLLFAGLADRLGGRTIAVEIPDGTTGGGLLERLAADHPGAAELLGACRVAVDREFADPAGPIPDGAEVALIPPVSGG